MSFSNIPPEIYSDIVFSYSTLEDLYILAIANPEIELYFTERVLNALDEGSPEPFILADKYGDLDMLKFLISQAGIEQPELARIIIRNNLPYFGRVFVQRNGFRTLESFSIDLRKNFSRLVLSDDVLLDSALNQGSRELRKNIVKEAILEGILLDLSELHPLLLRELDEISLASFLQELYSDIDFGGYENLILAALGDREFMEKILQYPVGERGYRLIWFTKQVPERYASAMQRLYNIMNSPEKRRRLLGISQTLVPLFETKTVRRYKAAALFPR